MSAAEVIIRDATADDVPHIAELIVPFVEQKKLLPRSHAEIAALIPHGFTAVEGERVVGFAAVEIYSRKLAEIQCMAVAEGYQRRGIGKQLVAHCVRRSRELNILELMAISASDAFLMECGFDYSLPEQKRALFYQPTADRHEERP